MNDLKSIENLNIDIFSVICRLLTFQQFLRLIQNSWNMIYPFLFKEQYFSPTFLPFIQIV